MKFPQPFLGAAMAGIIVASILACTGKLPPQVVAEEAVAAQVEEVPAPPELLIPNIEGTPAFVEQVSEAIYLIHMTWMSSYTAFANVAQIVQSSHPCPNTIGPRATACWIPRTRTIEMMNAESGGWDGVQISAIRLVHEAAHANGMNELDARRHHSQFILAIAPAKYIRDSFYHNEPGDRIAIMSQAERVQRELALPLAQ